MKRDEPAKKFGDVLLGGSRFVFWTLGPLMLCLALFMALMAYVRFSANDLQTGFLFLGCSLIASCLFLALLNGPRFWWAGRFVMLSVFSAYSWYLLDTWLIHPKPIEIGGPRSSATPWNALCGLVIIGFPCLCYTLRGRFTWREPPSDHEALETETLESHDHPPSQEGSEGLGR